MTVYQVRHATIYRYRRPVSFGEHRLLFRPRDSYDQRLIEAVLRVEPEPASVRWIHDVFGNCVALVQPAGKATALRFETRILVDHSPQAAPEFVTIDAARTYPFSYDREDAVDLARLIARHYPDDADEIGQWARRFAPAGRSVDTGHVLMTLCYAIRESFSYARRSEAGTQPPLGTLHLRRGTCRDFALFMMEAVRALGFAARFVSGYIYVADRDGNETLGGGATHAWCEVFVPGAGWVEFDPTNGIVGSRDLIRVAVARDPSQAIPLAGTYNGSASDDDGMTVQVNVTTRDEMPDTAWVARLA
ncbi:transglutaminase family protein [Aureimonas leprariae]|uniref:Transglutaminase family protein n=1 Tax=Plantimonas leprariae TaxID=2615207 RepID=A0A7V7PLD4_9HYPH|nr:transglutaminase family protein [Aureimonas leprariae]KAB0677173.1 transglutaminase family protein [Aureimonas leprariae]